MTSPNYSNITITQSSFSDYNIRFITEQAKLFELPNQSMPTSVFVCGRLLTFGLLGTDADCTYIPATNKQEKSYLRFPLNVFNVEFNGRSTLSLEYKNEIYHYNVTKGENPILATLLSVVSK